MKKLLFFAASLMLGVSISFAQTFPKPDLMIDLWPDGAPTENGLSGDEIDMGTHASNISKATLAVFLPKKANGLAIIACPGGGYSSVWDKTEGYVNARWYTNQGIVYAVLKYRLPNGHKEVPLDDVHEAMRILKSRADEFGFQKLGVLGCSAGGHLATTAATHYSTPEQRPDFQILHYAVISADPSFGHMGSIINLVGRGASQAERDEYSNEKKVTRDTPPAFIMANTDDNVVPVRNSIEYYNALVSNGVSAALHVYPVGGHGWTDHMDFVYRDQWMNDLKQWLAQLALDLK